MTNIFKTYIAERDNNIYVLDITDLENIRCIDAINGIDVDIFDTELVSEIYITKAVLLNLDSIEFNADNVISVTDYIKHNIKKIKVNEYVNKLNSLGDCLDDSILLIWRNKYVIDWH